MPKIPKKKKKKEKFKLPKKKKKEKCLACEGVGISSSGVICHPCGGSGFKKERKDSYAKAVEKKSRNSASS